MTEREELEYADKAGANAGLPIIQTEAGPQILERIDSDGSECYRLWNPREDDGDCAGLEAALRIDITWHRPFVHVVSIKYELGIKENYSDHKNDKQKARKHAVTRLAAEIGRAMK
jgi:hypothetical protein